VLEWTGRGAPGFRFDGLVHPLRRRRERREADRLLRASGGRWESHTAVAWRVAEVTSVRERRTLARSLRGIATDVVRPRGFSAVPLNRTALRPHMPELARLAGRVGDLERPVTGAGMLLVLDLLTDGGSPLYMGGDPAALAPTLNRIREMLEAR
jgi:hypothetical protein